MPKFIKVWMVTHQSENDLQQVEEQTTETFVNPEEIREFYARREARRGTRISFKNGAGIAVHDLPNEVADKITALVQ